MVGRRLALPLSPPASPLMTDRRPQFDQSILNWASAVEYDSNTDHHWQTDRSRLVHVSAGTESSSTTALQPPIGSVSTYGAAAHRSNLSHNPNPGCNQQYGSYVTPLQRPLVTLERYAGLSHPTNGQSTTTSKPEPAALTQTLGYEKGADIDNADVELSDADEEEESGLRPVTVAELRAHNRRLKRFRLTHSQTRYLMSEFARQPRPDAAQRERLSREVPGFSPRQVQVWFQNRRAKFKRLTNDDQEYMMRSRALPANFDMTPNLRPPTTFPKPVPNTPFMSPPRYDWTQRESSPLPNDSVQAEDQASYAHTFLPRFPPRPPNMPSEALGRYRLPGPATGSDNLPQSRLSGSKRVMTTPVSTSPEGIQQRPRDLGPGSYRESSISADARAVQQRQRYQDPGRVYQTFPDWNAQAQILTNPQQYSLGLQEERPVYYTRPIVHSGQAQSLYHFPVIPEEQHFHHNRTLQ